MSVTFALAPALPAHADSSVPDAWLAQVCPTDLIDSLSSLNPAGPAAMDLLAAAVDEMSVHAQVSRDFVETVRAAAAAEDAAVEQLSRWAECFGLPVGYPDDLVAAVRELVGSIGTDDDHAVRLMMYALMNPEIVTGMTFLPARPEPGSGNPESLASPSVYADVDEAAAEDVAVLAPSAHDVVDPVGVAASTRKCNRGELDQPGDQERYRGLTYTADKGFGVNDRAYQIHNGIKWIFNVELVCLKFPEAHRWVETNSGPVCSWEVVDTHYNEEGHYTFNGVRYGGYKSRQKYTFGYRCETPFGFGATFDRDTVYYNRYAHWDGTDTKYQNLTPTQYP